MALASSSTAAIAYLEESTYGTTPAGAAALLRMMSEDLKYDVQSESTKELNATRQVADSIIVGAESGGGVNLELNYKEYDPFLEALLASTFSTFGTGGVTTLTVSIVVSTRTVTDDGVDGFAGVVAGQWVSLNGTANGNDGVYRVATRTDDELVMDASTPFAGTDESASASVDVSTSRLSNGIAAMRSFSLEKKFTDVSQFFMFTGMVPSSASLDFSTAAIVTGKIGFLGKGSTRAGATAFTVPTPTASNSYGVMNAVTGVGVGATGAGAILARDSGDSDLLANTYVQSMKVNIEAGVRGQKAIGVLGNAGVALGTFNIGGTIDVYLADGTIYDEALSNNLVSIQFPVKDVDNNGYAFIFNNCKLGVPTVNAGGMDTEVVMSIPFTAVAPDTTSDKMLVVDRFGLSVA